MSEQVRLVVEYASADDLVGDFDESLSSGGTLVATTRELPPGTRIQLVLSVQDLAEPIVIEGSVESMGVAEGNRVARIEFDSGAREQLAAVIDRIRKRDPKPTARRFRVLIVEDNRHLATLLLEGIRDATRRQFGDGVTFEMRCAEDGRAAIAFLQSESFDVLVIDIYLPIIDGAQVISRARNELGLSTLPIIAVSAGGDSARRAALEAGATLFIHKPLRLRQMTDALQSVLRVTPGAELHALILEPRGNA